MNVPNLTDITVFKTIDDFFEVNGENQNYIDQGEIIRDFFSNPDFSNTNFQNVLVKVTLLNKFYSTSILNVYKAAKHVHGIKNFDVRVLKGDHGLVHELALMQFNLSKKPRNNYSFATKYCHHHNPSKYPIYDQFVHKALTHFNERDGFTNKKQNFKHYSTFVNIVDDFINYYGLSHKKYSDIDQFLWIVGKKYLNKNVTAS